MFKAKLKLKPGNQKSNKAPGNQNIQYCHKAAILKVTLLKVASTHIHKYCATEV